MIVEESGIRFDFRQALNLHLHDKALPKGEGNTVWKGVDFRVQMQGEWLWVEVKSWNPKRLLPQLRGGNQRKFVSKMKSRVFQNDLQSKFLGTTSFLTWKGFFIASRVTYILILEPPRPIDKALLGAFQQKLKSSFPQSPQTWSHQISVAVMDVSDWNRIYTEFPAQIL